MTSVRIDVGLVASTDLAILVTNGPREVWVPLSQIEEEIEEPTGAFGIVTTTAIIVPHWVAREKGLQLADPDEDTLDLFGDAP